MRLKIHGGTANYGDPSLCLTCRFATIVKGRTLRDEIVECSRLSDHARITFPVTFCTGYADKQLASIREMEDIAWVLRTDVLQPTLTPDARVERERAGIPDV